MMPGLTDSAQALYAALDEYGLHVAVRVITAARKALEQLCRKVTRPALAKGTYKSTRAGISCGS